MSAKANPRLVGLFVVGAFALAVAGVTLFGGGGLFSSRTTYVLFFDGSIGGLQVGAPVNFRGVRLGQVSDIVIRYLPESGTPRFVIPVYIQVEPNRIQRAADAHRPAIEELIDLGLRAQLGMQSFVTGQLSVELDFISGARAVPTGLDPRYVEIPTVPSDAEKLKASATRLADVLQDLPLEDIASDIKTALTAASGSVTTLSQTVSRISSLAVPLAEDITATVADARALVNEARQRITLQQGEVLWSANQSMETLDALLADLDGQLGPLSASAQSTLDAVRTAAGDASTLMGTANARIDPLSDDLQRTLASATGALDDARGLIRTVDAQAAPLLAQVQASLTAARETLVIARAPIEAAGRLAGTLDSQAGPLMTAALGAVQEADTTIAQLKSLIGTVDDGVRPIMAQAVKIADDASAAVAQARLALTGVSSVVRPGAPTVARLDSALRQVELAAKQVKDLAEFIQRKPNAFIVGR